MPRPTMVAEFELSALGATRLRKWFDALASRLVTPADVVAAIELEIER